MARVDALPRQRGFADDLIKILAIGRRFVGRRYQSVGFRDCSLGAVQAFRFSPIYARRRQFHSQEGAFRRRAPR
jgi:hypothetical protein